MEIRTGRSAIYKLLSMAIEYPAEESGELILSGMFLTEVDRYFDDLPNNYKMLRTLLWKLKNECKDLEKLQISYTRSFDLAIDKSSLSLYETKYVLPNAQAEDAAKFLLQLESIYLQEGVELSDRDMPDHLSTELEFMHFLCSKNKIEKELIFLKEHLLNWLPKLEDETEKNQIPFYSLLINVIAGFVKIDYEELKRGLTISGPLPPH